MVLNGRAAGVGVARLASDIALVAGGGGWGGVDGDRSRGRGRGRGVRGSGGRCRGCILARHYAQ